MLRILLLLGLFCSSAVNAYASEIAAFTADNIVEDAPIAMVVEMGSGQVLFAKHADKRFAPASITKVMTVYSALELISQGKLSSAQSFQASFSTIAAWQGKGTSMHLHSGENVPLDALLRGLTTVSANDAAVVLAEGVKGSIANWTGLMNENAAILGMRHSHFNTPNGWPDGRKTYVTARDLVVLSSALITRHSDAYHRYFGKKSMSWNGITQNNRDPAIGVVQGADGIKTGYSNEAGYNYLGSAERNGRRLIVVIGGSISEQDRAIMARDLLEWGFETWDGKTLFPKGAHIGNAEVQTGSATHVGLVTDRAITIALPRDGTVHKLSLNITYQGPIPAPISANRVIAQLELCLDAVSCTYVPLLASIPVMQAGPLDRLRNGLMRLLIWT